MNPWWTVVIISVSGSIGFVLGAAWCAMCTANAELERKIDNQRRDCL